MTRAVIVMAKGATPGRVKTRLTPRVSAERAAALQQAFINDHARRPWPADARWMFVSGGPEASFDVARAEGWRIEPQRGADLGERMRDAFETVLGAHESAMIFGTDSPDLPNDWVDAGFAALESGADVVLGPGADGGYWTLGLRAMCRPLFEGIAWSQPDVAARTLAKAAHEGLRVHLLPLWYDVDTVADLERLRVHSISEHAAHRPWRPGDTLAWLASYQG